MKTILFICLGLTIFLVGSLFGEVFGTLETRIYFYDRCMSSPRDYQDRLWCKFYIGEIKSREEVEREKK